MLKKTKTEITTNLIVEGSSLRARDGFIQLIFLPKGLTIGVCKSDKIH